MSFFFSFDKLQTSLFPSFPSFNWKFAPPVTRCRHSHVDAPREIGFSDCVLLRGRNRGRPWLCEGIRDISLWKDDRTFPNVGEMHSASLCAEVYVSVTVYVRKWFHYKMFREDTVRIPMCGWNLIGLVALGEESDWQHGDYDKLIKVKPIINEGQCKILWWPVLMCNRSFYSVA